MLCLGVDFLVFSCLVCSEFPGSVIWGLLLILENLWSLLLQYFFSLVSFCNSHYIYVTPFVIVPQFLDNLFFFILCFSLHFILGSFYWQFFKLINSSLGCVLSINEPIKALFISIAMLFISSFSCWFCLRYFISLLTLPLRSYM